MKKRVSLQECTDYLGVTRPTIYAWLREYNRAYKEKYDPHDIYSVLDFFTFLISKKVNFVRRASLDGTQRARIPSKQEGKHGNG